MPPTSDGIKTVGCSLLKLIPDVSHKPRNGMWLKIRGDTYHQVESFHADGLRISLVVEEYILSKTQLKKASATSVKQKY